MTTPLQAALNPLQPTNRPTRHRPQRNEREKLRAKQAKNLIESTSNSLPLDDLHAEKGQDELDWLPLADAEAAPCPVVFSPDAQYCFIASGSHVKIYSTRTTELLSTLSSTRSSSSTSLVRGRVSIVLLHPSNPRQLVIGSTDGFVRVWDYLEGKLLRTLDCQSPVTHATAHPSLPDQLFVALANPTLKKDTVEGGSKREEVSGGSSGKETLAGVYMISLRPKRLPSSSATAESNNVDMAATPLPPSRRIRLALPRSIRALSLSPDGSTLISLNPHAINLCKTSNLQQGFTRSIPVKEETLTTLAFHPTESFFATGNEKGQIRLWYNVLDRPTTINGGEEDESSTKNPKKNDGGAPTTSLLHWHVHPISTLGFTPNGAYLLSGGQEAVIVLWQLHTNHQEYIPRLGAPIQTLTVVDGGKQGGEQMVAAKLADGSVVFVGSQKLKIERTIAGLKSDVIAHSSSSSNATRRQIPLAVDPQTTNLVLPSGHPSSLQFYSPSTDSQILELEVSPSNRVSSASENKTIEPTRVERVAFSTPMEDGGYWMATVDEWQSGDYNEVRQLKFWRNKGDGQSFSLSTRVDRPHSASLTSLVFSPSPVQPILLTTSLDKSIKLWSYSSSAWHCRTSLSRRHQTPLCSTFSRDGSMFAVAFEGSIGVWSTARAEEICIFSSRVAGIPKEVVFAGEEGTELVVVGEDGTVAWDLLTLEETFSSSVQYSSVAASTSNLIAAESTSNKTNLSSLPLSTSSSNASSTHTLPFSISQSVSIPSTSSSSTIPSLAVVDSQNRVILVGPLAKSSGSIAPSRLPQANEGQKRLFDEIFGSDDLANNNNKSMVATRKGKESTSRLSVGGGLEILNTPAHSLPPVKLLWRSMLLAAPPPTSSTTENGRSIEGGGIVGMEIEGEEDDHRKDENVEKGEITYESSSPGSLAEIFRARLNMA